MKTKHAVQINDAGSISINNTKIDPRLYTSPGHLLYRPERRKELLESLLRQVQESTIPGLSDIVKHDIDFLSGIEDDVVMVCQLRQTKFAASTNLPRFEEACDEILAAQASLGRKPTTPHSIPPDVTTPGRPVAHLLEMDHAGIVKIDGKIISDSIFSDGDSLFFGRPAPLYSEEPDTTDELDEIYFRPTMRDVAIADAGDGSSIAEKLKPINDDVVFVCTVTDHVITATLEPESFDSLCSSILAIQSEIDASLEIDKTCAAGSAKNFTAIMKL